MLRKFLSKWNLLESTKLDDNFLYIFIHVPKCAGTTIYSHIEEQYKSKSLVRLYNLEVLKHLENKYGDLNKYITEKGIKERWQIFKKDWIADMIESMSETQRDSVRIIYGHLVYYGIHELFNKEARYFSFLREPISRTISHYNFHLSLPLVERKKFFKVMRKNGERIPFEEWVENHPVACNRMVWFLSERYIGDDLNDHHRNPTEQDLKNAKEFLKKLYFLGFTENQNDLQFIYEQLAITKRISDQNVSKKHFVPENYEETKELILSKNKLDMELYDYAIKLNSESSHSS